MAFTLYKLVIHTNKIASGLLLEPVKPRTTDVLHLLTDELNNLSDHSRSVLLPLEAKTRELQGARDEFESRDLRYSVLARPAKSLPG